MRNKRHLPILLALAATAFPHAMHAKGKGAPALEAPDMGPPPTDFSQDIIGYLGDRANVAEYERNRQASGGKDTRSFADWLRGGLQGNKSDELWQDQAIADFVNTGTFTKPGATGGDTNTPPVAPPAPVLPPPIDTGAGLNLGAPTMPTFEKAAPPVSDKSSEIRDAGREARRRAGRRKGYLSTLLAGETGGYQAGATTGQPKTLLGQ
jgi:hypothetical protein